MYVHRCTEHFQDTWAKFENIKLAVLQIHGKLFGNESTVYIVELIVIFLTSQDCVDYCINEVGNRQVVHTATSLSYYSLHKSNEE